MTLEQAINLLSQVCAQYKGTLEEHQHLQRALQVVSQPPVAVPEAPAVVPEIVEVP